MCGEIPRGFSRLYEEVFIFLKGIWLSTRRRTGCGAHFTRSSQGGKLLGAYLVQPAAHDQKFQRSDNPRLVEGRGQHGLTGFAR